MAPVAYDGMVIIGSAGGEWAIRGFVAAYDARSGKQRWRWHVHRSEDLRGHVVAARRRRWSGRRPRSTRRRTR